MSIPTGNTFVNPTKSPKAQRSDSEYREIAHEIICKVSVAPVNSNTHEVIAAVLKRKFGGK
jgi:hypothetical protein